MSGENKHLPTIVGRGSHLKPANRFLTIEVEDDHSHLEESELQLETKIPTEYLEDQAQSILSENNSPDIPFRYSINPYRGCAHGCAYCYARPTHEYYGFNAGLDFETKILVKQNAADLLRQQLLRKSWSCEPIMMSGVTDCYQPAERQFRLTRSLLEVALEFKQPVGIITKNALVTRDLDILSELAKDRLTRVAMSITSLDQQLTRVLEPRTSSPAARLEAMRQLSEAGVETTIMTAPVIPGLNDSEIPALMKAAAEQGAKHAGYILLRLPDTVRPVFLEWLQRCVPNQAGKVEGLLRQSRDGELNQSQFGQRMKGTGEYASHLARTFKLFARKAGLSTKAQPLNSALFTRPEAGGQMRLF